MRAKSEKRLLAERLRRDHGLSYREISNLTGISESTLPSWLRDIPLTSEQEARIQERLRRNRATFAARALPINRERYRRAREQAYQAGAQIVKDLPEDKIVDELAFAMLYLGDGSKSGGRVQLASTNPDILRYSLTSLRRLYDIDENRLSYRLNLTEVARSREEHLLKWWCQQLNVNRECFRKTQYDPRSNARRVTDEYHGVCTMTYNDTYLQQRILGIAYTFIGVKVTGKMLKKIK
jgi:transcriptional regulator with XRE-family HTH domain